MDPPPRTTDPFAPWLGPDDFELLRNFHASGATAGSPPSSTTTAMMPPSHFQFHATTSLSTSSAEATASLLQELSSLHATSAISTAGSSNGSSPPTSPRHNTTNKPTAADEAQHMTVDEVRREKNRQKVRRHYYRKLTHLNALRSEVEQLETTVEQLRQQQQHEQRDETMTTHATQRSDQLIHELTACRTALEDENENLRRFVTAQHDRSAHLRDLLATEHALFTSTQLAKAIFIKPLSLVECDAIRNQAVEDVASLTNQQRRRRSDVRAGFAGWHDDVRVENGVWKYSMHKTFRRVSPAAFGDSSWSTMTDPAAYARLYSSAVDFKCVVVQHVDASNVVLFQECRAMDADDACVRMKSLCLVSRVTTSTGELLVMCGLGEDRLQDRELFLPTAGEHAGRIVWHDHFSWTTMDRTGLDGEDCVVEFGGSAPTVGNNMSFWSVEILNRAVRWECAIHGTPLVLPETTPTKSRSTVV